MNKGIKLVEWRLRGIVIAALAVAFVGHATSVAAQRPHPQPAAESGGPSDRSRDAIQRAQNIARRLPADSTTNHIIELPDQILRFKATAGSIPLYDNEGALQAEVAYVAYVLDGIPPAARPVTFFFNGGPGAASAYLNLGAVGPWRLPLERIAPSFQPPLEPNAETWLGFTDLVFIDPPGTGYSTIRASGEAAWRHFWSVEGDAEALAVVIRKWLEQAGRQTSTKFIVGESYGGFRAPKVARKLHAAQGIGIRGLVLISPVLDFATFSQRRHHAMSWVVRLPSMAAAALEARGAYDREALREVERYAAHDYLLDLLKGERDTAAVERMSTRVAAFTGLEPGLVRSLGARIDTDTFRRELRRKQGLIGSAYDPNITAYDPTPNAAVSKFPDPVLEGTRAPLTSAMTDLYERVLRWRVEQPYHLLNREVSSRWGWGSGRSSPESFSDLREMLAADPQFRVLVTHGANDLVAPYFATQLLLVQLPAFGSLERVKLSVYPGGHMFYHRNVSRRQLRDDAQTLFRAALGLSEPRD